MCERIEIPVSDPGWSRRAHRASIDQAVARVLDSGRYILDAESAAFEQEFGAFLGGGEVAGVASGTDALHLALRCLGIGPGDLVATVSLTAVATAAAIELTGARPLFVEIDPRTMTMDPVALDRALQGDARVRAVVPVHLFGMPAAMDALLAIAARFPRVQVVEDAAQAHGARLNGHRVGRFGAMAAFSFYPTKNLGAFGDAGAVAAPAGPLAARARRLRQYGWREQRVSEEPGLNSRLDEIQAAVLRTRLPFLDQENARRREIATVYNRAFAQSGLRLPEAPANAEPVYHQYVVRHPDREALAGHLRRCGIGTSIHYPVPIHLQPAYLERARPASLAETESACATVLSLPIGPHLSDEDVGRVCNGVLEWERLCRQ